MKYTSFDDYGLLRVLRFLQTHNDEYISGQDLSDVLKISRVAVWKHIKRIREIGYLVESRQKLGYRLLMDTDQLLPWEVTSGLDTKIIGKKAYYFDVIESTQKEAQKLAVDPANDGAIITAGKQTHGYGRENKRWISQTGGIWFSTIIIRPKFSISSATLFPIATSLALAIAVQQTLGISTKLKWPNDLTIDGKKAAGILVDASLESNRIQNMIIGVGINYDVDIKRLNRTLKNNSKFYGAASLTQKNRDTRPVHLVQSFLVELEKIYDNLNSGHTANIISQWVDRTSTIGRRVKVHSVDGEMYGKAIRIDDDGALVVSNNGREYRVIADSITEYA